MRRHWQRSRTQADHADDWLMTYADMITLLLCFFVVFFYVSVVQKDKHVPEQRPKVLHQEIVEKIEKKEPQFLATKDMPQEPPMPPPILMGNLPFHDPVSHESPAVVVTPPEALPTRFEQLGDRITSLEISSAAFFASGSAIISDSGKILLQDVAREIKSDKLKDYRVTVEGHTDDSPINTSQFPSNWELSTSRASAVVHFFLDQGIPAIRLRAAGYADTFPKLPNRDPLGAALPENQAQNRRVVIKLEKIDRTY